MYAARMQTPVAYRNVAHAGLRAANDDGGFEAFERLAEVENVPLAALEGSELEGAFHAWIGRSRRRYIFTIAYPFEIDHEALRNAVIVCAARDRNGRRRALFIGESHELPGELRQSGAAIEVHYHLLATTLKARRAIIEDLNGEA